MSSKMVPKFCILVGILAVFLWQQAFVVESVEVIVKITSYNCNSRNKYINGVLKALNDRRSKKGFALLSHSEKMSDLATTWLHAESENEFTKPKYAQHGQYEDRFVWSGQYSQYKFDTDWIMANFDKKYHGKPWLFAYKRFYADDEWARTTKVGIACRSYHSVTTGAAIHRVMLFFEKPTTQPVDGSVQVRFEVPTKSCPPNYINGVLNALNYRRSKIGLSPMSHSKKISEIAQIWLDTKLEQVYTKPNYAQHGQFDNTLWWNVTGLKWVTVNISWDIKRFDKKYHGLPLLTAFNRYYTDGEWARTTKVGFACKTYHIQPSKTAKYVTAYFFEYIPDHYGKECPPVTSLQKTVFVNGQKGCPANFINEILCQFNQNRQKAGLHKLQYSSEISKNAQAYAETKGMSNLQPNCSKYGQMYLLFQVNGSGASMQLGSWEAFKFWDNKRPELTAFHRQFSEQEWRSVTKLGIGCQNYNYHGNTRTYILAQFDYSSTNDVIKTTTAKPTTIQPVDGDIQVNITIPSKSCPSRYISAVLNAINDRRSKIGLSPLSHSLEISEMAQAWLNTKPEQVFTKPNYAEHGQFDNTLWWNTTGLKWVTFDINWDMKRFDNTYHDKPWLSAYNRFYTNREWAHTTKVGFSCRTYHTHPSNTTIYVAAHFFEYIPEPATTVKPTTTPPFDGNVVVITIPSKTCPSDYINGLLKALNDRRSQIGLSPLSHSLELSKIAQVWLNTEPKGRKKPNYAQHGQFDDEHLWSGGLTRTRADFTIDGVMGKFDGVDHGKPWLTAYNRYYTDSEWSRTTKVGFSCIAYHLSSEVIEHDTLLFFEYIPEPATTAKPITTAKPSTNALPTTTKPVNGSVQISINFPTVLCSSNYIEVLLNEINARRSKKGLSPLSHSWKMREIAQDWLNTKSEQELTKPNYAQHGQFNEVITWGHLDSNSVTFDTDLIMGNFDKLYHGKPWLSAYNRTYTNREWVRTAKVGFGCRAYHTPENGAKFVTALFFEYIPKGYGKECQQLAHLQKTVFVYPQKDCPANFINEILCQFNQDRQKAGLHKLQYSSEISKDAQAYAETKGAPNLRPNFSKYGQLYWLSQTTSPASLIQLGSWDAFKFWNKQRPELTAFYRRFSEHEWRSATKLGIGCHSYNDYGTTKTYILVQFDYKFEKKPIKKTTPTTSNPTTEKSYPILTNYKKECSPQEMLKKTNFVQGSEKCPDTFID